MKKNILIPLLLVFTFFTSCAEKNLTKDEATKQIDARNENLEKTAPFIFHSIFVANDIGNVNSLIPTSIKLAKENGFLDYDTTNIIAGNGTTYPTIIITLKDKINPFIIKKIDTFNSYLKIKYFDVELKKGKYEIEITSISEPASDAIGRSTCVVAYKYKFIPTEIFKFFNPELMKGNNIEGTDTKIFIKKQDGWKLDESK